jgi:hypothetical protein
VTLKSQQALDYHAQKRKKPCLPPGVPRYHCDVCDKSFTFPAGLRQHQKGRGHLQRVARAAALAVTNVEAEEEKARETAREAALEAARLEEMLATGCGVCGIERFDRECIMLVHKGSKIHAAAVKKAAQADATAAAESAAGTAADAVPDDRASSSNDHAGDDAYLEECTEESEQVLMDDQRVQAPECAPECAIPTHIQVIFEANKYEKPDLGEYIRAGLTDEQVTWYDAVQVARYSISEKYPVDLEAIWQCVGFPRKDAAVRMLKQHLTPEMHYFVAPQKTGSAAVSTERTSYGPAPDQYFMTLEAAQHLAMGAPGKNGRQVRDMYIRVVQRVQDYEMLTRLYASFESARQAHHDAIMANMTEKGCVYLSQIMLVDGQMRRKGGYTDDTPKGRYTSGLREQFGTGPSRFLYDRVAVVCNPRQVEQSLLTRSAFTRHVHPVTLPNGHLTTETFSVEGMTVKQTHKEFDRIVKLYSKSVQVSSEDERREIRQHEHEIRQYEHEIKLREIDRDIEFAIQANRSREIDRDLAVQANRSKALDIELRKLEMEIRPIVTTQNVV